MKWQGVLLGGMAVLVLLVWMQDLRRQRDVAVQRQNLLQQELEIQTATQETLLQERSRLTAILQQREQETEQIHAQRRKAVHTLQAHSAQNTALRHWAAAPVPAQYDGLF